ncbi:MULTISPECIES: DUF1854 domain-containing protein [unclassified Massilia]|uniref:cyanophycin metabolism-associated DUF1854 family protein n=1 Tax=unclassified Massilia TaxID=2609279 RepID=UPI00067CCD05|nr:MULTISPECIES: DUF1854 domain-containing protein [unclassified Massilia]AKU21149.1 hypothetical protein ACZ75_06305 [Massilia sp. NR 4-1]UMR29257.1 DUF1854 domain-containing protein [Massilia sp. MB5]UTY59331.1 DUF1854 domain-containing protein [Massilia sp. erpn]
MTTIDFKLARDSFGRLNLTTADGVLHEHVSPVRAFPIQAPLDGLALVNTDGKEVVWIERLEDLPADYAAMVAEELGGREFMPEISRIIDVTSFATPCTWTVATDRGETDFVLRGEEDIRRIGRDALLVSDTHGIHFLIRNQWELDRHSKKILDRFL